MGAQMWPEIGTVKEAKEISFRPNSGSSGLLLHLSLPTGRVLARPQTSMGAHYSFLWFNLVQD